jgi:glycosyltransferase XagB
MDGVPKLVDGNTIRSAVDTGIDPQSDDVTLQQSLAELGRRRAWGEISEHEFEVLKAIALRPHHRSLPATDPEGALPVGAEPGRGSRLTALEEAVSGLRLRRPEFSASRVLSRAQGRILIILAFLVAAGLIIAPLTTGVALSGAFAALYTVILAHNIMVFRRVVRRPGAIEVSDDEARAIPDDALPIYTILVAAYREPEVVAATLRALEQLEYPHDRLDIKLLLEADDEATRTAARAGRPSANVEVVLIPPAQPRTKPKALNFGLTLARGSLVTVYDAEDRPEPLQLRRAVVAFSRCDPRIACLQAKLEYYNPGQNLLTGWFAVEYLSWFGRTLPAIAGGATPVPLGGTSTHMRRDALAQIGAWDPYNVTEDCDIGVRLYRLGYRTAILDSTTYEEANSDLINWVKQRSRWYKGFTQTWLVHMRRPVRLWHDLGPRGFCGFNLLVGATTLTALFNPGFWALTLSWFIAHPAFIQNIFPNWVYFPGLISMIVGNFLAYYTGLVTIRAADRTELTKAALLFPMYWALMSIGAWRAFLQLLVSPFVWEKTTHGLDRQLVPEPEG